MAKPSRRALSQTVELTGTGLHSGTEVTMRILPAPAGTGVVFARTDLDGADPLPATVETVTETHRRILLGSGGNTVQTPEHVLAALAAHQIDDARIELSGPEPPAHDGSAKAVFDAIETAGVDERAGEPTAYQLDRALAVRDKDASYLVGPASGLRLTTTIDYDHPAIGRQSRSVDVTTATFGSELAGARTFGFLSERDDLAAAGLAKGASPDNTIILDNQAATSGPLRWPDEYVRHKSLDLLGDLALLGGRLSAEVVAHRPSHQGNITLVRAIKRVAAVTSPAVAGIQDILGTLPHRYPMLLVDRILEIEDGKRLVGIKNVTINEPFFQGHFPEHPIMPGVLIVEAMAQAGGMMLMGSIEHPERKVVYFMSIDNVKFRKPVVPGDQLRFELEMLKFRGRICQMRGVGYVDGQSVAEADFMATIMDR